MTHWRRLLCAVLAAAGSLTCHMDRCAKLFNPGFYVNPLQDVSPF